MDQPDRGAEPNFTQPVRQIILIVVALALVSAGAVLALPKVLPVFLSNLYLNGVILFVFVVGLIATIWQVVQVVTSVNWVRGHITQREGHNADHPPRLLAPLAGLLRGRGAQMQIGATSSSSILDSVGARIEEERDITRYITNLLIFLGLLGTFYGLATTIPAVVDTIRSLAPSEGDSGVDVFNRLMTGLENQLGGMGTAFSSSLLGLTGSLIVGLLELFATHGQNRFYRELEEWLTSITRLGFAPAESEGAGDATGAWLGHLAEQMAHMAEQMEVMRATFAHSDESRAQLDARFGQLAGAVEQLAQKTEAEDSSTPYLARIAEGQARLAEGQLRMAEGQDRLAAALETRVEETGSAYGDAESRMRLRSIDVQLLRILEEMAAGRQESLSELRGDLTALTRAIRQLGGGQG